jgi:hypothetical protein
MQTLASTVLTPPPTHIETDLYCLDTEHPMKKLFRTCLEKELANTNLISSVLYDCAAMKKEFDTQAEPYTGFFTINYSEMSTKEQQEFSSKYGLAHKLRFDHVSDLWIPTHANQARFWQAGEHIVLKAYEIHRSSDSPIDHPDNTTEKIFLPPVITDAPMSVLYVTRTANDFVQTLHRGITYNSYNTDHVNKMDALGHDKEFFAHANQQLKEELGSACTSNNYSTLAQAVSAYVHKRIDTHIDLS